MSENNNKATDPTEPTGESNPETSETREHSDSPLSFWETLQSVLWAMLGVQKQKNAQRDFTRGKASHFIVIGILFAAVFVMTLIAIVSLVLKT